MIAAGTALDRPELCRRGLDLLAWLLDYETADGHLSPTPVAGSGAGDARPGFDQQPIEVATLADACARAAAVDPSPVWPDGVRAAAAWFHGRQRRRPADVGPGDRRRIRRPARRPGQPQPGCGVDAGGVLDASTRSALFDCRRNDFDALPNSSPVVPGRIAADRSRVITRLFVPGQEGFEHQDSRAGAVLERILALDERDVRTSLDDVVTRFDGSPPRSDGNVPSARA